LVQAAHRHERTSVGEAAKPIQLFEALSTSLKPWNETDDKTDLTRYTPHCCSMLGTYRVVLELENIVPPIHAIKTQRVGAFLSYRPIIELIVAIDKL
jgi:hypothetical protein